MEKEQASYLWLSEQSNIDVSTRSIISPEFPHGKIALDTLPIYTIGGTEFYVEAYSRSFIEKERPQNHFAAWEFQYKGSHYEFLYHPGDKTPAIDVLPSNECILVQIPPFVQLDPQRMAEKYQLSIAAIQGKSDFEVMVDQQAFKQRMQGHLPTLDILGQTFEINLAQGQLSSTNDKGEINLQDIQELYDSSQQCYVIPYDLMAKAYHPLKESETDQLPAHIQVITFPKEIVLDRVGWNIQHGYRPQEGLMEIDYHLHFKAGNGTWQELLTIWKNRVDDLPFNVEKKRQRPTLKTPSFRKKRGIH